MLVDNILDLAKIEAGKMGVACEHFDLRDLLEDVTRSQLSVFGQNRKRLELIDLRPCTQMASDEAKVRSIVTNVLAWIWEDAGNGDIQVHVGASRNTVWICVTAKAAGGVTDRRPRPPARERSAAAIAMVGDRAASCASPGLAVAQRFCETLDGRLEVRDGRDGETRVSISLPDLAGPADILAQRLTTGPAIGLARS